MSNGSIYFFPKRSIISSMPPVDQLYRLDVRFAQFDQTPLVNSKSSRTLSGIKSTTLYSITDSYSVKILSGDPTDPTPLEMKMFLRSVVGGEIFHMDNIDEGRQMDVELSSRWSRTRPTSGVIGEFDYAFSVDEVIS